MARYIDADALLEELNFIEPDEELYESDHAVWLDCRMDVIHAPTADVEEVKHGEWFMLDDCANEGVYCSVCRKKVYKTCYANQKLKSPYCPNCGAKMDGKGE